MGGTEEAGSIYLWTTCDIYENSSMIFPYLKYAPKLSSGAKGLSETMVEPTPEAWTGIR